MADSTITVTLEGVSEARDEIRTLSAAFQQVEEQGKVSYGQLAEAGTSAFKSLVEGDSPLKVLSQQGTSVASAFTKVGGVIGRVATLAAGPWGIAITGLAGIFDYLNQRMEAVRLRAISIPEAVQKAQAVVGKLTSQSNQDPSVILKQQDDIIAKEIGQKLTARADLEKKIEKFESLIEQSNHPLVPDFIEQIDINLYTGIIEKTKKDIELLDESLDKLYASDRSIDRKSLDDQVAARRDPITAENQRFSQEQLDLKKRFEQGEFDLDPDAYKQQLSEILRAHEEELAKLRKTQQEKILEGVGLRDGGLTIPSFEEGLKDLCLETKPSPEEEDATASNEQSAEKNRLASEKNAVAAETISGAAETLMEGVAALPVASVAPGESGGVPEGFDLGLPQVFEDLGGFFEDLKELGNLPKTLKDAFDSVKDTLQTVFQDVKTTFTDIPGAIKGAIGAVTGGFKGLFKGEDGFLGGLAKLFSKDGPLAQVFSKDGPLAKLFAKDGAIGKIFSKDGPLAQIFDKDGPIGKLFSKDGPVGKLFSKDGPLGKLFDDGGPLGGLFDGIKGLFGEGGPLGGLGKIFSKDGGLFGGLFGEGGIASKAGEFFKPLTDGIGKTFSKGLGKLGSSLSGALGGALGGAQLGGLLSIFGDRGQNGAKIGGAVGSFLPIPGGGLIGATLGKIFGGLFGSSKRGSATIVTGANGFDITNVSGKGKGRKEQAQQLAGGVISQLNAIAQSLGGEIASGLRLGSIGTRKKKFVFDPTGQGNTKGRNVQKFRTEEEAVRAALRHALSRGAVDGLSAAVKRALTKSSNIEVGLQEALKVQDLEAFLKQSVEAPLKNVFLAFEQQAKQRLDVAKRNGFSLVELERRNAEERAKILSMHLENLTAPVSDLLRDLTTGSLAGGSPIEQLARLEDEQKRLFDAALAGDEAAIAEFAAVSRDYVALAEDVHGTAGAFGDILSTTEALAQQIIDQATTTLEEQQKDAQIEAGTLPDPQLSEMNESMDEVVYWLSRIGRNGELVGGKFGLGSDTTSGFNFSGQSRDVVGPLGIPNF